MSIKKEMVPKSVEALREELKKHPDIYDYAILGTTFEDCLGRIAVKVNLILDGYYDVDDLCDKLIQLMKKHKPLIINSASMETSILSPQGELILPESFQKKPTVQ